STRRSSDLVDQLAARPGQLGGTGPEARGVRRGDDREHVEQGVLERAARGDLAGIGDEPGPETLTGQVRADGGGRADRELERRGGPGPRVRRTPRVEEHR